MKIKSEFKPFQGKATYFSPLALITLAACGGGGGGVAVSGGGAAGAGGAVIKGPLENALVFIDYNKDGVQQADEPSVRTGADGSYFIEHAAGKDNTSAYDVVAVADAGTVDASSGASAAGFTLSAPKEASVVTPTTTMIAEGAKSGVALTSADVATALGLPAGVDPLTFNPYASGVNAADALAAEKVAQQLMTTVSAFSATLEGAGASSADAFALALNSVVEVVKDNKTAGTTLDLTDTAAVTSIGNELDSQMTANGDPSGLTKAAWNALKADTIAAIEAVTDNIQGVTSLTSNAAKGSFGNVEVLKSQVKAAATLEAATPNSGVGQIGFTNPDTVASSANNLAPTAISISKASISEAADSLVVGTITTTDADQGDGVPFKYSIAQVVGEDFAKFSINESTGVLTILEQPDYETKTSYTVSIKSEDGGKKSLVKKLTIAVEDANDPPTLDGVTRIAAVEDAGNVTGTFSAVDANGDTLTYLVPGLGAANGVYTKEGTYGTLTLNETTGAYTYALDNANETVDNLLQFTPRAQVEKLTSPTVPTIASGDKFKITVNETVIETAAATTESTLADIATMLNTANTALGASGVAGTFTASGSDLIFTYTAGGQVSGTLGKLFFLDSSAGIAYDSGTGTGATLTVGATQFLTETFTIQVYDGNYYVSKDVTFNIKGVNDIAVLTIPTDGKVTEVTDNSVVTATGVIAAADNDSDTPTVTLTGVTTVTDVSGTDTYQKVGTYGTLVLTKNPTGNQVEQITAPTVPTIGSGDKFKVTLNGTDIETAAATTEATLADIATMLNTANAALASTVPGTFAAVGSDLTFTYTAVGPQSGTISKLFYTVNAGSIDSGTGTAATKTAGNFNYAYTYTLNNADADTVGLSGGDLVTDSFGITVTDEDGGTSSSNTLDIKVQGYGVTIGEVAGDGKINIAEATEGFTIAGRGNAGKLVTLTLNSGITLDGGNTATVDDNGDWSIAVTAADVTAMGQGSESVTASIALDGGSVNSAPKSLSIDTVAPTVAMTGFTLNVNPVPQVEQITAPTVPTIGSGDKFKVTLNGTDIETAVATTEATLADIATMLNTANAALASTVPGTFAAVGSDLTFTYTAVGPQSGTISKLFYTANAGSIDSGTGTAATLTTGTGPTITASGTGFLGLGSAGQDVTSLIDLTKIAWDVDGDGADLDYLATGDATAVVVSDTSLKLTLSSAKYSALIAKPGFGADGIGAVNLNDKIVVLDGAFTDGAGNTQADGAKTAAVSYSDTTKPLLASFTSSSVSAAGTESFALGASINITATMNEAVLAGSTITATLSTNAEVVLTAAANGTTLVGTYTVPASTSSNGLTVNSFKYTSVSDLYGAAHSAGTSGTIPGGKNLADHATMKIDTLPPDSAVQSVKYLDAVTQGVAQVETLAAPTVPASITDGAKFKVTVGTTEIETAAASSASGLADIVGMLNAANTALGAGGVAGVFAVDNTTDIIFTYASGGAVSGTISTLDYASDGTTYAGGTGTASTSTAGTARGTIELTGTGFTNISTDATADVKAYFDWTKFVWDLDGDDTNAGVTFAESDILSAKVTSGTKITVVLTDAKTAALEATAGFAASGIGSTIVAADEIDVSSGFIRDAAGNVAIVGSGNTNPAPDVSVAPTYANVDLPTLVSFTTTTADKSYKVGDQINITANLSENVVRGSSLTVTLNTGDSVVLTANSIGTKLVGTYTVSSGDDTASLKIDSVAATTGKTVTDIYGKALTGLSIPANQNLSNNSNIAIDTTAPTATVTSVEYNATANTIVLGGTNFTTAGAQGADIKAQLDWTKFVWDIDGSSSDPGVAFTASDIELSGNDGTTNGAKATSNTVFTIALNDAKAAELEGKLGFGADGLGSTDLGDQLDLSAGFFKDATGNASTTDAALNTAISYTDQVKPTVSAFTSSSPNGSYNDGDTINITATMSETVLAGSMITVTLPTSDKVELTTLSNSNTLTGIYTVSAGDNVNDLSISSFALETAQGAATTVTDVYGNFLTDLTLPTGASSLAGAKNIQIDNIPNAAKAVGTIDASNGATDEFDADDSFILEFIDTVSNTAEVAAQVTGNAVFGATGTPAVTEWSSNDTKLKVTLKAGETFSDGGQISFTNVKDDAENLTDTITFTVDIA